MVRHEGSLIVLEGVFEKEVRHALLGTIVEGTLSKEFFWTDRWYSVFRFREPWGALRNFYGNINTPVTLSEGVLSFRDLDLDVLVTPEFSYQILDQEEFEQHSSQSNYPQEYSLQALRALAELLALIKQREFPFNEQTGTSSALTSLFKANEERNHFE